MRPGMQCVLDVLRGQAGYRTVDDSEFRMALKLAEEERVLPLFLSRFGGSEASLSKELQIIVEELRRNAAIEGFLWQSELKFLLRAFAAEAIPVIPLKGPFLAQRLYGGVALRSCRDLDILVHWNDVERAEVVLAQLGFERSGHSDGYDRKWLRGETKVELHFDVANRLEFDFDIAGAWKRACLDSFASEPAWKLGAEDELLFLCLHGVRHRFDSLSLIIDLSLAIDAMPNQASSQFHLRPEVSDLTSLLLLGCALAQQFNPASITPFHGVGSKKQQEAMQQLANELWGKLLTQPAQNTNWWPWHHFYLRLEVRPFHKAVRRILHMRVLAIRVIEEDFAFAAKWGFKRTWQAWLLRPVRLLIQRMQRQ